MQLLPLERLSRLERQLKARLAGELLTWTAEPGRAATEPCDSGECLAMLIRAVDRLEERRRDVETRLREVGKAVSSARHRDQVRDLVMEFLAFLDPDPRRLAGDRAAFARHMGIDAAAERARLLVTHLARLQEVALQFAGLHATDAMRLEPAQAAQSLAAFEAFVMTRLRLDARWQGRVVALSALASVASALPPERRLAQLGVATVATITTLALDVDENLWVQREALELLYLMRPEEGLLAARRRLLSPPAAAPDDFFLRKHAVTLLGRDGSPTARELLLRVALNPDGSEYVRRTVLTTLASIERHGAARQLGRALLARTRERSAPSDAARGRILAEPCPQVRAQAAIELGKLALAAATADPDGFEVRAPLRMLARAFETDRSVLVRRIAAEEAGAVLTRRREAAGRSDVDALDHLVLRALDAVLAGESESLTFKRYAATARETILVPTLAAARVLLPRLPALIAPLDNGATATLPRGILDGLDTFEIGRVLAHLSRQDFSLSLIRSGKRWRMRRGEMMDTTLWRLLHELTHPSPDKRQAFNHTVGRILDGELRAPSGILGELTMTKVPGEKVFNDLEGEWRRYLPTVDDYLSLVSGRPRSGEAHIFSSSGVTSLRAPRGFLARLRARIGISRRYAELAGLRAATSGERPSPTSDRYIKSFERLWGFQTEFKPHAYRFAGRDHAPRDPSIERVFVSDVSPDAGTPAEARALVPASSGAALPLVLPHWFDPDYFLARDGNHINHLTLFAAGLLAWFLIEQAILYRRLRGARKKLPLVLGGWGTRGKSGSERLKAGLFHGLGYSVFSKTTGCEAMFIHSVPGMAPMELFLFRPYDKATIWEQHFVVRTAHALGADVFLWECMALKPDFVFLLQHRWVQDDLSTLTNAYPDHEDIQGPAGINIPEVMVNFCGPGHAVFTAEDQMLPILAQGARKAGSDLRAIDPREVELLTEDLLGRFPYREHPKNIVMVLEMARELGIDSDLAIKEMADHVVPDLGVLKTYPMPGFQPAFRGRTMEFANGMSANERRGTVENWRRMGYDQHSVEKDPFVYLVTVVNNRADRVARSKVFASVIVNDLHVDAHVPIGSNLTGLVGYTMTALEEKLSRLELIAIPDRASFKPAPLGDEVLTEWKRQLREAKTRGLAAAEVLATLEKMAIGAGLDPAVAASLTSEGELPGMLARSTATHPGIVWGGPAVASSPDLDGALAILHDALSGATDVSIAEEVVKFFETDARRFRTLSDFQAFLAERGVGSGRPVALEVVEEINEAYRKLYRGLYQEKLRVVHDFHASGDQVIDFILKQVPPGMHVKIMGIQNIKGTGLGFVYRWISLDKVCGMVKRMTHRTEAVRRQAIEELAYYGEYGILDAPIALAAAREARRAPANQSPLLQGHLEVAERRIQDAYAAALRGLTEGHSRTALSGVLEWIEAVIDFLDSRGRRRQADQVMRDLVDARISHEQAVLELRALTYRQKGGWLEKGLAKWWAKKG
ncbi:MAG: hypothetical protein HY816_07935 [Candidatus Wallbacteria bacterium]|nr:hypothetical protein [Candidatus Wallbacteria bacterium]